MHAETLVAQRQAARKDGSAELAQAQGSSIFVRIFAHGGPWRARIRVLALVFCALALIASAAWVGGEVAASSERRRAEWEARTAADIYAASLRSELAKFELAPLLLAGGDAVERALRAGRDNENALSRDLERVAARIDAGAIYAIRPDGETIASSNWRAANSFVGENYSFRSYFQGAMRDGEAALFALGTVSGLPGLYLSRRVEGGADPIGVIVVKVQFERLEETWAAGRDALYVAGPDGVILVTTDPSARFRNRSATPAVANRRAVAASTTLAAAGARWTLDIVRPVEQRLQAAGSAGRSIAGLAAAFVLGACWVLLRHRTDLRRRALEAEAQREALERRVRERTTALSEANRRLLAEADERARIEAARQTLQDELAQANRLAVLGQITAAVAHEINQPVAAIRANADNASVLVARGATELATAAIGAIADLTERIGAITGGLRDFARARPATAQATSVQDAVRGALLLLSGRINATDVAVQARVDARRDTVIADPLRLQQVLVNLIQNAMDAVADRAAPRIVLDSRVIDDAVEIVVADNGPGVDPTIVEKLFLPFQTTKPDGLGLGLAICCDMVADWGGDLRHEALPDGAAFIIRLRRP